MRVTMSTDQPMSEKAVLDSGFWIPGRRKTNVFEVDFDMDCRSFQKNLEDYLEGGLDFGGRFGMERHAQQCYVCGRDIANARWLAEMARGLKPVAAPPHFESAVLARIHAKDSRSWFWSLWIYG